MNVTLDSTVAKDLILFKLQSIHTTMERILTHWDINYAEDFILKVQQGEIPDGEMDAITVRQLLRDIEKYSLLLKSVENGLRGLKKE